MLSGRRLVLAAVVRGRGLVMRCSGSPRCWAGVRPPPCARGHPAAGGWRPPRTPAAAFQSALCQHPPAMIWSGIMLRCFRRWRCRASRGTDAGLLAVRPGLADVGAHCCGWRGLSGCGGVRRGCRRRGANLNPKSCLWSEGGEGDFHPRTEGGGATQTSCLVTRTSLKVLVPYARTSRASARTFHTVRLLTLPRRVRVRAASPSVASESEPFVSVVTRPRGGDSHSSAHSALRCDRNGKTRAEA